jgi:hypothetical protein
VQLGHLGAPADPRRPPPTRPQAGLRGINLSGGQRQRLNLARCAYYGGNVVLLDNALSAVRGPRVGVSRAQPAGPALRRATAARGGQKRRRLLTLAAALSFCPAPAALLPGRPPHGAAHL